MSTEPTLLYDCSHSPAKIDCVMNALTELQQLRQELLAGRTLPSVVVGRALAHANSNVGKNVYISLDSDKVMRAAEELPQRFPGEKPALYGLPVSLKDCFDLAGFHTSCGTRFYADHNGEAVADSAVAARLRTQGAVIIGKTHLHPLAYGITGENPDYGDCTQPRDPHRLTGGSSSGAVASVQEGSAIAAIGTDTGGSIRVPAALCGLAGYRATLDAAHERGLWRGSMHLAQSFDTLGWIFRDVRDAPLLAEALFGFFVPTWSERRVRIACVDASFTYDSEPGVLAAFASWQDRLRAVNAEIVSFDVAFWEEGMEIFAPIQANEAAAIHASATGGDFSRFEPLIAERLRWGASLDPAEIKRLRRRHAEFRDRMDQMLADFDFLIVPCAPVSRLVTGADHSDVRSRILRYTVPLSLAGAPVVALPGGDGAGVQLASARGADASLLSFTAHLASADP